MAGILEQRKTVSDADEILVMDEREFKALMCVSPQAFVKVLAPFAKSHAELKQQAEAARSRPRQRKAGGDENIPCKVWRANWASSCTIANAMTPWTIWGIGPASTARMRAATCNGCSRCCCTRSPRWTCCPNGSLPTPKNCALPLPGSSLW